MMFKPFLPYMMVGALVISAASGYKVRDWQCDAAHAKALEKAEKSRAKKQEIVNDISQTYEAQRDQANVVATERTNTIREIYRTAPAIPIDCAAPDDVFRLLESGVRDANAAATGKPNVELPETTKSTNIFNRP